MKTAVISLIISMMCNSLLALETLSTDSVSEIFEKGVLARDVQLSESGESLILYDLNLIEDDGPGANSGGRWWEDSMQDVICQNHPVRKVLKVDHPEAMSCYLTMSVVALEGETLPLKIYFNSENKPSGYPIELEPGVQRWQAIPINPEVLVRENNEILLSCDGKIGWEINIASREDILRNAPDRKIQETRSFKSTDGGKTWSDQLGSNQRESGEYHVRLNMNQYVDHGILQSPVIDLSSQANTEEIICQPVRTESIKLIIGAKVPAKTNISFAIRTSDEPDLASSSWSEWEPIGPDGSLSGPFGRFMQWQAILQTEVATLTPKLQKVEIEAKSTVNQRAWAEKVTVVDSQNEQISYTSIPFEYEVFDEAQLVELRSEYKLDEVVAGAGSELEKMIKLRNWVSRQWEFDPPMPPYPAWDAREILERRQGFCVQYAIVYMQCALSLGIQTRFVFGDFPHSSVDGEYLAGHEVNEFWSNEYGKWIMMDAQQDRCFVDRLTGIPLSMLELHEESVRLYYGEQPIDLSGRDFAGELKSQNVQVWKSDEPDPRADPPVIHPKWGTVRWMPRNNFYAQRFPEPISQGRIIWSWTGYWQWEDGQTGREWRFPRYTSRQSDVEWTLNQVQYAAAYGPQPGEIEIKMATVTPDLDTLFVRVDNGDWKATDATFNWHLKAGSNRLEMCSRNRAGVMGRSSWLELHYLED